MHKGVIGETTASCKDVDAMLTTQAHVPLQGSPTACGEREVQDAGIGMSGEQLSRAFDESPIGSAPSG